MGPLFSMATSVVAVHVVVSACSTVWAFAARKVTVWFVVELFGAS